MRLVKRGCFWTLVVGFALALSVRAFADLDGAKKALDELKKNIADDNTANIDEQIKMVDFELKDTPDADKKPIQDELDQIKKKIHDDRVTKLKPGIQQSLESYFTNAKEALADNRPDAAVGEADRFDEYITHEDIKNVFTDDEIAAYKTRMNKLRAMGQSGMNDAKIGNVTTEMDNFEKDFNQKISDLKTQNEGQAQMNVRSISDSMQSLTAHVNDLPQDNDKVKALKARLDKFNATFNSAAGAAEATQKLASLKDNWSSYSNEYQGWEAETPSVTFEQYGKTTGNTDMHAFNMPHSVALIKRADDFLGNLDKDDSFKAIASMPEVASFVGGIKKSRDDAYAKVLKAATTVVEGAEKTTLSNENVGSVSELPDDIRVSLGEKSPDAAALKARAQKIIDNYHNGLKAADAAFEQNYKNLSEAAGKAWPDMAAKYKTESGFDPDAYKDFKGKLVKINTDNLMGWKFKPGDFPFATTINGKAVAGRYDPVVAAAIKDVEAKVKHELGDIDQDGRWDIIARVEGTTGRMMTRQTTDVRSNDGERLGSVEYSDPVDAPIVTIIAAHCGPLAVTADQGAVNEAGVISAPPGVVATGAGSTVGGWLMRFVFLLVGLIAAAAALLKAGYAPIASLPQAGEVQAKLGGDNLAYIGLCCAAWGVLWLLIGLIYRGFIPNVTIIAAGLFAAIDFLAAKGIVKPDQVAKIKPLGVPIGLACAGAVVLSFLLALIHLNLVII